MKAESRDPQLAALLSFLVPGLGQIGNGELVRAAFWLALTPLVWIGAGGLWGSLYHVLAAFTAGRRARRVNWKTARS